MIRFSRDFTRIQPVNMQKLLREYTRVKIPYNRQAAAGEQPPDLGQVSELIRNTLTKEYNIYPPNLSTAIQQDQTIVITAVNQSTGLNIQVTLKNLAANFVTPGGTVSGIVPTGPPAGPGVPAAGPNMGQMAPGVPG